MTGPLAGLTVVVTGEVPGLSRGQAQDAVVALGGKPVGSVSGKTGLVVVGDGAGVSKMAKTRQHGLTVIAAEEFAALAADPASWDGTPVGEPIAVFDARTTEPEPEPDPQAGVPMAERHLVGVATCYPRIDGVYTRQVRMSCQCGHKWFGESIHAPLVCPVAADGVTPVTVAPWETVAAVAPEPWVDVPVDPADLVDFTFDDDLVAVGDW